MRRTAGITRRTALQAAAAISAATLSGSWIRDAKAGPGGTLTVALSDNPITCDPINMASHDTMIISQTIWENLLEFDVDGILKPQLAKALPEISADKLVYTFDLRDDVVFQNGKKLTAEDVKDSFEYMLDPKNKASRRPIFDRLSHVEIDSPYRLRVVLKEPYSPWVYFLTKHMAIWPKGSRQELGDDHFRLNPKGVGTGPGIFEEWKPNDYVSLVRNPNYWQKGKPAWDRLVVKFVPEDASRVAYLLSGQIDMMGAPPPRDFTNLKKRNGIDGDTRGTFGGWSVLLLNNKRPPFDDVNFRRALAHAVDRETITKRIFYGLVEKSAIPAPASSWWFNPAADKSLAYDLDKAKFYLKKSKYADGASFELMTSAVPYLLDAKDCIVFLQSEFAKLGIEVKLRMADAALISPAMFRGNYDAMFRNIMSPGEATYFLSQNFLPNQFMSDVGGYQSPRIAELLKIVFAENDEKKLKPVYDEIMQLLADESPFVWVGYFNATNLWRKRVGSFKASRGLTINIRDVSLS
ncbi:ABC transporter substrate-binding protein [Reyranella soli]|uniref:ABC transporter substrate-binding protein n=1 Tax=Reyranella soli TaxID=1230389 RepID=A0A512NAQ6_9HYPH|nr:ABC transporter substrate-binding protein [Reyranella soli]GEP55991.1 ABC transporter substrate-binding protein [Reyranella soli]